VFIKSFLFLFLTAEEYFTSKSMFDVRELKENHPEFALLLEKSGEESVQFSNLSYTKVPVHDLEVGSHILVRAGEVCYILYRNSVFAKKKLFSFHSFFVEFHFV